MTTPAPQRDSSTASPPNSAGQDRTMETASPMAKKMGYIFWWEGLNVEFGDDYTIDSETPIETVCTHLKVEEPVTPVYSLRPTQKEALCLTRHIVDTVFLKRRGRLHPFGFETMLLQLFPPHKVLPLKVPPHLAEFMILKMVILRREDVFVDTFLDSGVLKSSRLRESQIQHGQEHDTTDSIPMVILFGVRTNFVLSHLNELTLRHLKYPGFHNAWEICAEFLCVMRGKNQDLLGKEWTTIAYDNLRGQLKTYRHIALERSTVAVHLRFYGYLFTNDALVQILEMSPRLYSPNGEVQPKPASPPVPRTSYSRQPLFQIRQVYSLDLKKASDLVLFCKINETIMKWGQAKNSLYYSRDLTRSLQQQYHWARCSDDEMREWWDRVIVFTDFRNTADDQIPKHENQKGVWESVDDLEFFNIHERATKRKRLE